MTEDEAKTKWCPAVRYVINSPIEVAFVGNRFDGVYEKECKCIASDCAWWVWDTFGAEVDGEWNPEYPTEGHCGAVK